VQAPVLAQSVIVMLAASLVLQQKAFIESLKAENRMREARLCRRQLIVTDTERRLFDRHAKAVGREKFFERDRFVSFNTLLLAHRGQHRAPTSSPSDLTPAECAKKSLLAQKSPTRGRVPVRVAGARRRRGPTRAD
jgi:hypothetical protein